MTLFMDVHNLGGPVTIDDVARTAGVSTATVSRALRGLPHVHERTRAQVHRIALDLGYVPSKSASTLASGRTRTVGVVTPHIAKWYFAQAIEALENELRAVGYDVFIDDAEVIEVGRVRLDAIHTPGHTPGSISFHVRDTPLLFTGDTLFPGGPGNTTFEGGDFPTIMRSLTERLFTLPDETLVLPGHGDATTIGTERPSLDTWAERGW